MKTSSSTTSCLNQLVVQCAHTGEKLRKKATKGKEFRSFEGMIDNFNLKSMIKVVISHNIHDGSVFECLSLIDP